MTTHNQAMRDLQSMLVSQLNTLDKALDKVTDPDHARAIVREMQEINHRVSLAGSLLFASQAAELSEKVKGVAKATKKVELAVKKLKSIKQVLETISAFLSLVDDAIDLAKGLV